jgi:hypothetical protein
MWRNWRLRANPDQDGAGEVVLPDDPARELESAAVQWLREWSKPGSEFLSARQGKLTELARSRKLDLDGDAGRDAALQLLGINSLFSAGRPAPAGLGADVYDLVLPSVVASYAYGAALRDATGSPGKSINDVLLRNGSLNVSELPDAERNTLIEGDRLLRSNLLFARREIARRVGDRVKPGWLERRASLFSVHTTSPMPAVHRPIAPMPSFRPQASESAAAMVLPTKLDRFELNAMDIESFRSRLRPATPDELSRWCVKHLDWQNTDQPQLAFSENQFPVRRRFGDADAIWVVQGGGVIPSNDPTMMMVGLFLEDDSPGAQPLRHQGVQPTQGMLFADGEYHGGRDATGPAVYAGMTPWTTIDVGVDGAKNLTELTLP